MPRSLFVALALLRGIAPEANGRFMLVAPESSYLAAPGVTSAGPNR